MTATTFDTLKFSQKLESAGFTHEQAIGASAALAETFTDSVATKHDLKELELRLTIRLGGMIIVAAGVVITGVGILIKIL